MSYDSSFTNANPNSTQVPARHDDLPAVSDGMKQPFQPIDTTQVRSGGANYPYVDGGDRPEPADNEQRWGLSASHGTSETDARPGALDYRSGADTLGAPGTGNASAGNGPAARQHSGGGENYADQGIRVEPMEPTEPAEPRRLHSDEPHRRSQDQRTPMDFETTPAQDTPPTHRLHSQNDPLPRPESEHSAYTEERPLNVQPAREGGVAIDGRENVPEGRDNVPEGRENLPEGRENVPKGHENLPEGHASVADKVVGKTQKVVGKMTKNLDMHERGELRETGGKAAVQGEARAAYD